MRPIHMARLDKARPVLVLTREQVRPYLSKVTVAPVTSTVRGLATEVLVGPGNGLDHDCAVSLDNVVTIESSALGRHLGYLLPSQEPALARAVAIAFDLETFDDDPSW